MSGRVILSTSSNSGVVLGKSPLYSALCELLIGKAIFFSF